MEILWAGVMARSNADSQVQDAVCTLLLLHAVYLISVYFSLKTQWVPPVWLTLAAAALFRITAAPMPAILTDDLARYEWEGRIQTEGRNPYSTRPSDTGDFAVPGRDFRSVYGPLTLFAQEAAFRASGGDRRAMKAPAILGDLAVVALIAWAAPGRLLIYAWSPMPIVEFWGQGHNDSLVLLFITAALLLPGAGAWLGLAAAAKWWPLVLLPALARGWRDWVWALAIPAAAIIPFVGGVTLDQLRFSTGFLGGWRNTDFGYGLLLALTSDAHRAKYSAFAILAIVAFGVRRMPWTRERKGLAVVLAMLAVSANVHPWYLTWTLPFLVLDPIPWVFLWGALMPLAYETAIRWRILGEWEQSPEIRWMIYAPVAAMALFSLWLRRAEPTDRKDRRDQVG